MFCVCNCLLMHFILSTNIGGQIKTENRLGVWREKSSSRRALENLRRWETAAWQCPKTWSKFDVYCWQVTSCWKSWLETFGSSQPDTLDSGGKSQIVGEGQSGRKEIDIERTWPRNSKWSIKPLNEYQRDWFSFGHPGSPITWGTRAKGYKSSSPQIISISNRGQ